MEIVPVVDLVLVARFPMSHGTWRWLSQTSYPVLQDFLNVMSAKGRRNKFGVPSIQSMLGTMGSTTTLVRAIGFPQRQNGNTHTEQVQQQPSTTVTWGIAIARATMTSTIMMLAVLTHAPTHHVRGQYHCRENDR